MSDENDRNEETKKPRSEDELTATDIYEADQSRRETEETVLDRKSEISDNLEAIKRGVKGVEWEIKVNETYQPPNQASGTPTPLTDKLPPPDPTPPERKRDFGDEVQRQLEERKRRLNLVKPEPPPEPEDSKEEN